MVEMLTWCVLADEERFLTEFFGDEYVEYKKRSWVGIPLCQYQFFAR